MKQEQNSARSEEDKEKSATINCRHSCTPTMNYVFSLDLEESPLNFITNLLSDDLILV